MPAIISHNAQLASPKLAYVIRRMGRAAALAVDKIAANSVDPEKYPLPEDRRSLERVLKRRFDALRPDQRQFAEARVGVRQGIARKPPSALTLRVLNVDPRSTTPVLDQAKRVPRQLRLTKAERARLPMTIDSVVVTPPAVKESGYIDVFLGRRIGDITIQPTVRNTKLELRVSQVKCIDETNGWFGTEVGSDEIYLAGDVISAQGSTSIEEQKVGDFDDGDVKSFSPAKVWTSIDLLKDAQYPKVFVVVFVLAEKDMGGLSDFMDKLVEALEDPVKDAIVEAIGAAVGGELAGPIGAAVGVAVGVILSYVIDALGEAWADDVFDPQTITFALESSTDRFSNGRLDSDNYLISFEGQGGEYSLTYSWRLYQQSIGDVVKGS
jgi:hypothetical protein